MKGNLPAHTHTVHATNSEWYQFVADWIAPTCCHQRRHEAYHLIAGHAGNDNLQGRSRAAPRASIGWHDGSKASRADLCEQTSADGTMVSISVTLCTLVNRQQ